MSPRRSTGLPPSGLFLGLLSLTVLALAPLGCRDSAVEDPRLRIPLVVFDVARLGPALAPLAQLEGTPIARAWNGLETRLGDCAQAGADWPDGTEAAPRFVCLDAPGALSPETTERFAFGERLRGEHAALLLWPLGEAGRLALHVDVGADDSLAIEGRLRTPEAGALDLLVPHPDGPAPGILEASPHLAYARLRPAGGLQIARFLPEGGQADRLFALKGRLLEGALLEGTFELGFLPPRAAAASPRPIGALHHRGEGAIRTALEEALDQLEATWPLERSPRTFATVDGRALDGGCYRELPLLPGLAPCWVVTPKALVIAWEGDALDLALGRPAVAAEPRPPFAPAAEAGRVLVHLDRFARADEAANAQPDPTHLGHAFSKLAFELSGVPDDDAALAIRGVLERRSR